jgi:hypothetical protein
VFVVRNRMDDLVFLLFSIAAELTPATGKIRQCGQISPKVALLTAVMYLELLIENTESSGDYCS